MSDLEKEGANVYLIGATNCYESLDPAFVRSGRFGLHIEVKAPDLEGTEQIFDIHTKNKPLDKNLNKKEVCEKMHSNNFTGADIAVTVKKAYSNALERCKIYNSMDRGTYTPQMLNFLKITNEDFKKAIDTFVAGKNQKKRVGF